MTIQEANKIVEAHEKLKDRGCTCFQGHPPCSYCEDCPSEEMYNEAIKLLEE